MIQILNPIDPSEFSLLYGMLEAISLPMITGDKIRRGFQPHRATGFGLIRQRLTNRIELSYFSKKHPHILEELNRIGDLFCPIKYTSIYVNNNVVCPKHKDGTNIGDSMLVSFGEYTGGNIMIEGVKYNADCQPIVFNGANLEHWNSPDLIGNKYSLIFYSAGLVDKKFKKFKTI